MKIHSCGKVPYTVKLLPMITDYSEISLYSGFLNEEALHSKLQLSFHHLDHLSAVFELTLSQSLLAYDELFSMVHPHGQASFCDRAYLL